MALLTRTMPGRVLLLNSCKGGVGTSFLTACLGQMLVWSWNLRTLVVDAQASFGDLALMLNQVEPSPGLEGVQRSPERLDDALLHSLVRSTPSGCWVLSGIGGCPQPGPVWEQVCSWGRRNFDVVLVDGGRAPGRGGWDALPLLWADKLLPVIQPTLPMVRDGRLLVQMLLQEGKEREQIIPIMNAAESGQEVLIEALERALGTRLELRIPLIPDLSPGSSNPIRQDILAHGPLGHGLARVVAAVLPFLPPLPREQARPWMRPLEWARGLGTAGARA